MPQICVPAEPHAACRQPGLQSSTAFSHACAQQQPDLQQDELDSSTVCDFRALTASPANSPHEAHFSCTSGWAASSPVTAAPCCGQSRGSSASIDQRLSWSLRPADARQLPEGMLALAAEARAAQQRATMAELKTELSLAALMDSSSSQFSGVEGLKLLGSSNLARQEAPATNIQLVAGSSLGTGLHTPGARLARCDLGAAGSQQQQQPRGRRAGLLLQQLPRPASAPCYSPVSSSMSCWGPREGLCNYPHAARAGRYLSPQPQVPGPSVSPLSVTAASAAGASARDKLHSEKLQSILGPLASSTYSHTQGSFLNSFATKQVSSSYHCTTVHQPHASPLMAQQPPATWLLPHAGGAVAAFDLHQGSSKESSHQLAEALPCGRGTCMCCGASMSGCCGCCSDLDCTGAYEVGACSNAAATAAAAAHNQAANSRVSMLATPDAELNHNPNKHEAHEVCWQPVPKLSHNAVVLQQCRRLYGPC